MMRGGDARQFDEPSSVYETWDVMTDPRQQAEQSVTPDLSEHSSGDESPCPSLEEMDDRTLAALYAEFADEDRALANAGLTDYASVLSAVDEEA
jgi:hypothetical protein